MPTSPTERTLRELRKRGYVCQVVEKWIPKTKRRLDLFGCIDIIACGNGHNLAVQATSWSNVKSRINKVQELISNGKPIVGYLSTPGNKLEVWGWKTTKKGPQLRVEPITIEPGGTL